MKTSQCRTLLTTVCGLSLFALPAVFAGYDADAVFKKTDLDGDGKITRSEHAAAAKDLFKKCDADRDSFLTVDEMDSVLAAKEEKSGKSHPSSADKIKSDDTNGDSQLSFVEYEAGSEKLFSSLDSNSDGSLSKAECAAGHKE